MPLYMFDTDISSYIMKRSNAAVLSRLAMTAISDTCISAITKSELMFGIANSPRPQLDQVALDAYLKLIDVFDYPSGAAAYYADIRAYLKQRGALIGSNDLLIAAHALCLGLTLVTNNTREFSRVPHLKIENWTL